MSPVASTSSGSSWLHRAHDVFDRRFGAGTKFGVVHFFDVQPSQIQCAQQPLMNDPRCLGLSTTGDKSRAILPVLEILAGFFPNVFEPGFADFSISAVDRRERCVLLPWVRARYSSSSAGLSSHSLSTSSPSSGVPQASSDNNSPLVSSSSAGAAGGAGMAHALAGRFLLLFGGNFDGKVADKNFVTRL